MSDASTKQNPTPIEVKVNAVPLWAIVIQIAGIVLAAVGIGAYTMYLNKKEDALRKAVNDDKKYAL